MDLKELQAIDDWAEGKTDIQPTQALRTLVLERRLESASESFDWRPDDYKGMFEVSIGVNSNASRLLTLDQRLILSERLELVQRIALRMALNMVKGILKYKNESGEVKTEAYWLRHTFDDASDTVNYIVILAEQMGIDLEADSEG